MPHRSLAALAATGLCLLAACGSEDDEGSTEGGTGGPAALEITLNDAPGGKSEVVAPRTVEAGLVEVSVTNEGKRPHNAQIVGGDGEQSQAEVSRILQSDGGPIPSFIHGAGGVGMVAPGESATATDVLEPGRYFVFDTEGGGAAELEVTGEAGDPQLPETEASITAEDYGFATEGLKPGSNEITFENVGEELHHVIASPINPGVDFEQVREFVTSDEEPSGRPPIDFESSVGTAVLDGGKSQVTELELRKGRYALLCFIQDRKGGPPHVAKGMVAEVAVK